MIDKRALSAIESRDPDGGSIEPTAAAYAAHEAWAIATYGPAVWDVYCRGGWDDYVSAVECPSDTSHTVPDDVTPGIGWSTLF